MVHIDAHGGTGRSAGGRSPHLGCQRAPNQPDGSLIVIRERDPHARTVSDHDVVPVEVTVAELDAGADRHPVCLVGAAWSSRIPLRCASARALRVPGLP